MTANDIVLSWYTWSMAGAMWLVIALFLVWKTVDFRSRGRRPNCNIAYYATLTWFWIPIVALLVGGFTR